MLSLLVREIGFTQGLREHAAFRVGGEAFGFATLEISGQPSEGPSCISLRNSHSTGPDQQL
jgi:hypothetical protein